MATTFYLTNDPADNPGISGVSDWGSVTWGRLSLTRGNAAASRVDNSVSGLNTTIPEVPVGDIGHSLLVQPPSVFNGLAWVTNPLNAVTIAAASSISANLRALESNAMVNYGVGCQVYRFRASDGQLLEIADRLINTTELGTAEAARTCTQTAAITNNALSADDRLLVLAGYLSAGGTSGSGFTATFFYDGPTGGASGDSFITFVETITEVAPAYQPRHGFVNHQDPGIL